MKLEATFVRSAPTAADLPRDGLAEIAVVGRSNVGKSSLINALVRQRVARTSRAAGKTRLANVYRVARAPRQARGALSESKGGGAGPFYLVDLPGYGYARGGREAAAEFDALTQAFFRRARLKADTTSVRGVRFQPDLRAALLLVDSRHPGLRGDIEAWRWLAATVDRCAIVATKIDKLSRAERLRAMSSFEAALHYPVLPFSAVTGEGLDELWKLIDRLTRSA